MRTLGVAALLALVLNGCAPAIQGYSIRESRAAETRRMAAVLDPLLVALDLPSLHTITAASRCRFGFAVVRTSKVNVWSTPATESPCVYFSLFVTEGALAAPTDELMAMIAHELGHITLHHTPQSPRQSSYSSAEWRTIQRQELEADRFAVALLKRLRPTTAIASCEAMGRFLRRGVADWYGESISARMEDAVSERVESAEAACTSIEVALPVPVTPVSLAPTPEIAVDVERSF
jgi:hypothetical protein